MTSADTALISTLREVLAASYVMYFRAHSAHWNVEGEEFPAYHEFFGDLYEDVFGAIDHFAEAIRQHGGYAPVALDKLVATAPSASPSLGFETGGKAKKLFEDLTYTNEALRKTLKDAYEASEAAGDLGLCNFIQDRMAAHLKWAWQLKVTAK
jgi:starvation-inducible DNA-binding protein